MQAAHRVAKNTGFLYAKMGITMFISLYTTRLILDSLGASDFGIFNIVGGAIAMLGFLNAAMAAATQRFMSYAEGEGNKEKQKQIFNISLILHFAIAILLVLVLLVVGYFFFNGILNIPKVRVEASKLVYASLMVSTAFTVMTVPYDAVLNARENMKYYAIVGVIESVLKLGAALAIVNYGSDKLILFGVLMACIPLIIMTIMRIYCNRNYEECVISPKKYWDRDLMKEMGSFAGWNFLVTSSSMISHYGLGIVLNSFYGTILNAALGIANQISGQLMAFSSTMMKAVIPAIVKSEGAGQRDNMLNTTLVGTKVSFFLVALFVIPVIIETPFVLEIWLKDVPEWAVVFTRFQLLRALVEQITLLLNPAIFAQGDIKIFTKWRSIIYSLPILLTWLLFYFGFAPYYMYIVWIIFGSVLGNFLLVYFAYKKCGMSVKGFIKSVFIPCIGCTGITLIFGIIPSLFLMPGMARLILTVFLCVFVFFSSIYLFFLTLKEKQIIVNLFFILKSKIGFLKV